MPNDFAERITETAELLEALAEDRGPLRDIDPELRKRLLIAAGRFSRPGAKDRRKLARAKRKEAKQQARDEDRQLLDRTRIRVDRAAPLFKTPRRSGDVPPPPPIGTLNEAQVCYVCHEPYTEVHHFYDQMCCACGDFNVAKRNQTADLEGRVALVTGARVKIGYQTAILMLRAGASVIVTTRFPHDAARRYAAEPDFEQWRDRLEIYGIDLRQTPAVEELCAHVLRTRNRLDVLINNACQTVRRPPGFYDHLLQGERQRSNSGLVIGSATPSAELSQLPLMPSDHERGEHLFPLGKLDADAQQIDLRRVNSWRLKLAEVPTIELLEVHLVNAVAPFVLNARLKPLLAAVPTNDAHIVNVSAMEGQFYRTHKSDRHPHTNMAKAALNMMTRTSGADYAEHGIHMNSVDTGWVSDEDPVAKAEEKRDMHDFHPPLDIVDGAARICDPVFHGLNTGEHVWGQFLKDYRITDW